MTSPASVAIMSASARRFLSKALHNRAPPAPEMTLTEPQNTYGITIQRKRLVLPRNTAFIQMCLFDIQSRVPLGLPQRFRVNEVGEVSPDTFSDYFVRAQRTDRVFLVFELIAVNEDPNPDRPFQEEAIAFGFFPIGVKATDQKETVDITLSHGGAASHFCSLAGFKSNESKKTTMGGLSITTWVCDGGIKAESRPSKFIVPPHRFISSEVATSDIMSGRVRLPVMKVSLESFTVANGNGRTENSAVSNAQWSVALLTHTSFQCCSRITSANLFPYENNNNTFKLNGAVEIDDDTPIHESSHLVVVLRRQTPTGPEGIAVAAVPLCPRVGAVRDALVRVTHVPLLNGPLYPMTSASPESYRSGEFVSPPLDKAKMFGRTDWACSMIIRFENTPVPAPKRNLVASGGKAIRKTGGTRRKPLGQRDQNEGAMLLQQQAAEQQLLQQQGGDNDNNEMIQSLDQQQQQNQNNQQLNNIRAPVRPKGSRPSKQLPIPSVQDFSEDPQLMQATPDARQQFVNNNNNTNNFFPMQNQQQRGGGNSNVNGVSYEQMQQQLATMKEELFNYLKQISQEVGTVRGEVNQVSKFTKQQQQQQGGGNNNNNNTQQVSSFHEDPIAILGREGNQGSRTTNLQGVVRRGPDGRPVHGVRVADVPLSRSQTALSSKLRMIILDRQQPIRHPITRQPLAPETVLCSQHLNESRFCIRVNGITLRSNAPPSPFQTQQQQQEENNNKSNNNSKLPPRKFAFRIHSGLTVQKLNDAGLMITEAPLPALTGGVCATSDSGETLYALRLDPSDASAFAAVHNNKNNGTTSSSSAAGSSSNNNSELLAAQSGHWLEPLDGAANTSNENNIKSPALLSQVQLQAVIPQYVRKLRKERQALLFSSTPAAVTIEVLDGYSRFTIGYASLPIDAFDRPATTTHTMKEEDLLIRSEAAFWRDATGEQDGNVLQHYSSSGNSGGNNVCPLHKPVVGVLHLTACSIGFKAVEPPGANNNNNDPNSMKLITTNASASSSHRNSPVDEFATSNGRHAVVRESSSNALVPSPRDSGRLGVVEVPKLNSNSIDGSDPASSSSLDSARYFQRSASTSNQQLGSNNNNTQQQHKPIPPHLRSGGDDGSGFLTSARLSHLHSKRVEILKSTLLASSSTPSPRGGGSSSTQLGASSSGNNDRMAMEFQTRVIEKQREERKQDRIQDALFKRMQLETPVVCPSGRPAIADFRFTNPYPATMAFTLEFVKPVDPATLVTVEAAGNFGHSFICAPLEERVIQVCVRSKYSPVPKTASAENPQCIGRVRVLDDKGEVVKVLIAAATVLPPQVDRVLHLYGGTGSTISKDIFVRCFDQALVVSAEKGEIGLSKLNNIVQRLCCYVRCSGDDVNMVRKATTGASIQYLYDGAVAAWEELFLSVNVPSAPSTAFLHIFADEHQQNCLMTWALRVTPVQVFDSQPVLCGQTNSITLPIPGMRSVFCTNGGNPNIGVSASCIMASSSSQNQQQQQQQQTLVQLKARPMQPHVYSVLVHAAESEQSAQAGKIVICECRIQARLPAPTFAKTIHVPPSTVPLFLRVVVRNDDATKVQQPQRAFRVSTNYEAFVSVKPSVFLLGPGDQMPVSISVAVAALASGRSGTQVTKYPIRLTVTDNDDKITDVFQIELIVDPQAGPIENVSSRQ